MKKLITVLAFGMLAAACVPHDEEQIKTEPDPYWRTSQQPTVIQPQTQTRPVVVQQKKVIQPEQSTWWQENKQKHVVKVVVPTCPCKDPNDPCPQCYQK